jgi:hypothetical protein
MPSRRDGNPELRKDLQRLGFGDDFGFDARRGKQGVEHHAGLVLFG